MTIRRCPQCHSASDDQYGFCTRCGYEFSKIEEDKNTCPYCGFSNPEEATYCVKCGTPLILKYDVNESSFGPIVIKKVVKPKQNQEIKKTSSIIVILGYVFSLLGGILGLIIALYLVTRKNPADKRHGYIQLAIFAFYMILIIALFLTGNIPQEAISEYQQLLNGNFTSLQW